MTIPLGAAGYTEGLSGRELVDAARRLERWGYDSLWIPEVSGREPLSTCGYLLAQTEKIRIGTGIANVYVRDANVAAQGSSTLAELSGGRFSFGLGASHPLLVEHRGHQWEPPLVKLRKYLEGIESAALTNPQLEQAAPLLIAAHGPKLLQLAADKADGVLMYMQPSSAIRVARNTLGADKQLHAVVRCVYAADKEQARDIARRALAFYIQLPAYHRAWQAAGFEESDWQSGGSDRLIDALCACGDIDDIRVYMDEIEAAGASHLLLSPLHPQEDFDGQSPAPLLWHWEVFEGLSR